MVNYKDIYADFLDLVSDSSIEEFVITEDHKRNLFYMGMFLMTNKKIKIVNDTKINLYQKIYDYWNEKYKEIDFQSSNNLSNYFLIITNGFSKYKREKWQNEAKKDGDKIFFSTKNAYNYLDNFDYKACLDNMDNLGESNTVIVKYDRSNISQYLELGIAYCLNNLYPNREIILSNKDIELNDNDFGDKVIIEMQKTADSRRKTYK